MQAETDTLKSCISAVPAQIDVIPHGVPDRHYVNPANAKPRFDLDGRKLIFTNASAAHAGLGYWLGLLGP